MEVSPLGGGEVKIDDELPDAYPTTITLENDKLVLAAAFPAPGYTFSGWSGDLNGTVNPTEIYMTCAKKITANFSRTNLGVNLIVKGGGSANLIIGDDANLGSVNIVAKPDSGWRFDSWTGDVLISGSTTIQVNLDTPKMITANFSRITHNLVINVIGGGSTCPTSGSHSYNEGEIVTIVATADNGWRLGSITGDATHINATTVEVTVDAPKSVTAYFVKALPSWLFPLSIIVTVVLFGLTGYYTIHKGYLVIRGHPTKLKSG